MQDYSLSKEIMKLIIKKCVGKIKYNKTLKIENKIVNIS